MSDLFKFEEYREIELKVRDLTKRIKALKKEREELLRNKVLNSYFKNDQ